MLVGIHLAPGPECRWRHSPAVLVGGVCDPSTMHQLRDHDATFGMNGIRHLPPTRDMRVGDQARGPRIPLSRKTRIDPFADDHAGRSALSVIRHHQVIGVAGHFGAGPGHGCHDNSVPQSQSTEIDGVEKRQDPLIVDSSFFWNHRQKEIQLRK